MIKRIYIYLCLFASLCSPMMKAQMSEQGLNFWHLYCINDEVATENDRLTQIIQTNSVCDALVNNIYKLKAYAKTYIPTEDAPIMTVRINLIFIRKDDGTGNFQENDPEHQQLFDDIIDALNNKVSFLILPGSDCFSGTDADMVHDMRIRFVDHRYYVDKSAVWDNGLHEHNITRLRPATPNWYLNGVDDSINNVILDTLKGINIYFTEDATINHHFWDIQDPYDTTNVWTGHSTAASAQFPSYTNWSEPSRIHMPCIYSKFWYMKYVVPHMESYNFPSWENEVRSWMIWGMAGSLLHELGHVLDLLHPINDLPDNPSYPSTSCFETIMQPDGGSPRNFLPPIEIGRMYFAAMATNLQQYIPTNTYLGTKSLNSAVVLPHMRMYYSLEIGPSGNVTIPCDITFSPRGYIEVQNGGVLTIDNSSLKSIQNSWGGIIVQSGGLLLLSDVSIEDYNVEVKSGGCLVITDDLTITGDHSIAIEDGGYLCVDENASVDLVDKFSLIVVSPNAILGCPSCSYNCVSSRENLSNSGSGSYVLYTGTSYLQNTIITSDTLATGNAVYAGYDVTNDIPYGNVVVEDGGELRIKANETTLTTGVEVKLGGTLTITNP